MTDSEMTAGILPQRGSVVLSSCGRDKGLTMVVLEVTPAGILLADGRERLLQHPKRKNPRHVIVTCFTVDESSMATNRELRRALRAIQEAQCR